MLARDLRQSLDRKHVKECDRLLQPCALFGDRSGRFITYGLYSNDPSDIVHWSEIS